jgi:uncharacterized membrane protein
VAKALPLKMRARLSGSRRHSLRHLKDLEAMAETGLPPQVMHEIEMFERQESVAKHKELGFLKGRPTELIVQDFIGAAFGAMFFVVTQEVWDFAARMQLWQMASVVLLSAFICFAMVYYSRRRRFLSEVVYKTMAMRGIELYAVSLITSFLFVVIFGTAVGFAAVRQSIVIALPATVSAATADLLFY